MTLDSTMSTYIGPNRFGTETYTVYKQHMQYHITVCCLVATCHELQNTGTLLLLCVTIIYIALYLLLNCCAIERNKSICDEHIIRYINLS